MDYGADMPRRFTGPTKFNCVNFGIKARSGPPRFRMRIGWQHPGRRYPIQRSFKRVDSRSGHGYNRVFLDQVPWENLLYYSCQLLDHRSALATTFAERRGATSPGARDTAHAAASIAILMSTLVAWRQAGGGKKALDKALTKAFSVLKE